MALSKLFQRIFWHNNTTPAINEDNLNAMSKAIDDIDDRVIDLGDEIMENVPIIVEGLQNLSTAVTTAQNAATTATTKAGEASASATTASNKAGQAATSATTASNKAGEASASATTASNKADAASASATTASNKALVAEGYAVGEQNGTAVTSGSPYYHNNAEYYAGEASGSAAAAAASATDAESWSAHPPYIGNNGNWYVWDTETGQYIDSGVDASISVRIADITMLDPAADPYVTNTGTPTDPIFHLFIPRGKGVTQIVKTGTSGLVDTYTITFSDGATSTFTVTNGKTAYQSAVEGGYTGTEAEFEADLANFGQWKNDAETAAANAATSEANAARSASAASTSASNAATSETNAAASETAASGSAGDAEAWAEGTRNGSPVPSTDPAYQHNAKYWADQAGGAMNDFQGATASTPGTHGLVPAPGAGDQDKVLKGDGTWGDAAAALVDLTDVNLTNPADGDVLVYDGTAHKWKNADTLKQLKKAFDDLGLSVVDGEVCQTYSTT